MLKSIFVASVLIFFLLSTNLLSDEIDMLLDGFEEDTLIVEPIAEVKVDDSALELGGIYTFSTAYNYSHKAPDANEIDYRGFSRLRNMLNLHAQYKIDDKNKLYVEGYAYYDGIYEIKGRSDYSSEFLSSNEREVELQEAYLNSRVTDNIEITIGRKIVVWGKSDNIRITDVLNPMDNREPAMVDIENLRLPVTMTKLDITNDDWIYSLYLIHEPRFSKISVPGSDFFPLPVSQLPGGVLPDEESKDISSDNTQYAFSASGLFSGWDLSFYAANIFYDKFYFEDLKRKYALVDMLGASYNAIVGSFLFKVEGAYFNGLRYTSTTDKKNRIDLLVGIDYNGIQETSMTLEVANRHINDYEAQMKKLPDGVLEDETTLAFRISRDYLNDTLTFNYLSTLMMDCGIEGGFQRFWVDYDLGKGNNLSVGVVDFIGGDYPFFDVLKNSDRAYFTYQYYF